MSLNKDYLRLLLTLDVNDSMVLCLREHEKRGGTYEWGKDEWPNRNTTRALENRGHITVQGEWPDGLSSTLTDHGRALLAELSAAR